MQPFTHLDSDDQPGMVDVSDKNTSKRTAIAESTITLGLEVMKLMEGGEIQSKKGPIFQTAIIAGTMAAKKTSDWIPLCHPIPLESCKFNIEAINDTQVSVRCTCITTSRTGVEMEALTGASAASLTIYDMCKAVSKAITIDQTRLVKKTGGKSDFESE